MRGISSAPAPTTYNISSNFGRDHPDFNRTNYSSMFQKPIAEPSVSSKSALPAPNQYDVRDGIFFSFMQFWLIIIDSKRIEKNNKIQ
jgi:hypothetical protein